MIDRLRINEYLEDISQQLKDLKKLTIPDVDYLLNDKNFERRKAIERSLELAIQGVIHISCHLCAALGLKRLTDDTADAIIALGQEDIIPIGFAKEIRGMVSFRNRLAHEYLPSEFDPHKLYENLQRLDDFRKFSHYIVDFLETEEQHENP